MIGITVSVTPLIPDVVLLVNDTVSLILEEKIMLRDAPVSISRFRLPVADIFELTVITSSVGSILYSCSQLIGNSWFRVCPHKSETGVGQNVSRFLTRFPSYLE